MSRSIIILYICTSFVGLKAFVPLQSSVSVQMEPPVAMKIVVVEAFGLEIDEKITRTTLNLALSMLFGPRRPVGRS